MFVRFGFNIYKNYRRFVRSKIYNNISVNIAPFYMNYSTRKAMDIPDFEDISIKVSYGSIEGKIWNKLGKRTPILALHGWLDNAGSWDHISPLLDREFPVIAIDFQGHGLSPFPSGSTNSFIDMLAPIERVIQHFKWGKVILLGHSMGGALSMIYSGTFPERVEKLIMIDTLKPFHVDPQNQPKRTADCLKELIVGENKLPISAPKYSYDELLSRTINSYRDSITEESAMTLLKRGSLRHQDGTYSYRYSSMVRVTSMLSLTLEQVKGFASNVNCEMLVIVGTDGLIFERKPQILRDMIDIYKKASKKFLFRVANGSHHVHMNNPSEVSRMINKFLNDLPLENEKLAEEFILKHYS